MTKKEITQFLQKLEKTKERNIVLIDYANVDNWESSLGWKVGIKQLGTFISHIAYGKKYLRRFYYGEDYGQKSSSNLLLPWSATILQKAKYSGFEVVSKRVKYIPDDKNVMGFTKKCNLDIEMAIDLISEVDFYDTAILFTGDGDLAAVCEYIYKKYQKTIYIFGARNHVGKEFIDAKKNAVIKDLLFAEDFEYRFNLERG